MSAQAKQDIRIKPSLVPFAWKGFVVVLLGIVVYGASFVFMFPLPSAGSVLRYAALALIGIGLLGVLIGAVRRNTFTYLITDSDVVVKRQLLRRSVRRIPFSSISDVQVSQSIVGRLARYGDVVPVTKSGYGLVRGTEPGENIVAEMADVPNQDKVADLIMSRLRQQSHLAPHDLSIIGDGKRVLLFHSSRVFAPLDLCRSIMVRGVGHSPNLF